MPIPRHSYRFETAPYSYFLIRNYDDTKQDFLAGTISNPKFQYYARFNPATINRRLATVAADREFARNLHFVGLACALQHNDRLLTQFRHASANLYSEPNWRYYNPILARYSRLGDMKRISATSHNLLFQKLIEHGLKLPSHPFVSKETFARYKRYFNRYFTDLDSSRSLKEAMQKVFKISGLAQDGWRLLEKDNVVRARTISKNRTITYNPYQESRGHIKNYNAIALHEVFGHAVRDTGIPEKYSLDESEGWAVALEQLYSGEFQFRRAYRYLAAALAWGCFGEPLDFRCTFEALWRMMALSERYSEVEARSHAFDEVARIFRGGRPDLPGAVFLKDTAYLRGNLRIWRYLDKTPLAYEDFVDILEGRRSILS